MLTQACHKIESNMMGTSSNASKSNSPKRTRSEEEDTPAPSAKQAKLTPPGTVSQPLSSLEKRLTPERPRPSSSSTSTSSPSVTTSVPPSAIPRHLYPPLAPMLPPGYPPLYPPPVPTPSCHQAGPCTNALCTDFTCPTGAARASILMGVPPASLNLLTMMQPPAATAATTAPPAGYVCNWMSSGEFCGKRFNSSEDLMTHLRTHTSTTPTSMPSVTSAPSLAALQAAQTQAMASSLPGGSSALAALHAQAAKMASTAATAAVTHTTTSSDLAAAAAARYHAMNLTRPPMIPPSIPALPPHLASLYGLGNPYSSLPVLYP